jgi:hypothetical protein
VRLQDPKAALVDHARTFAECKCHATLLEYLGFALGVVQNMPHWDSDAHNKVCGDFWVAMVDLCEHQECQPARCIKHTVAPSTAVKSFCALQPKQQAAKALEALLIKAVKAVGPASTQVAALRDEANAGLELSPAARLALGLAAKGRNVHPPDM